VVDPVAWSDEAVGPPGLVELRSEQQIGNDH